MDKIAIIGVGCRFPGADNPDSFWKLLSNKVDAIKERPSRPFDWDSLHQHSVVPTSGKSKSLWGGFLEQVDSFDPHFFQISPKEAERLDPQQRLVLEVAWESLENAGIVPSTELSGTKTGVFLGAGSYDYALVLSRENAQINAYNAVGTSLSIIANRLSYILNLQGPSLVIDTACSSSLVAIHYACQSLLRGETHLCLAGGINLILSTEATISLSHAQMMAADGRCKSFDAAADGYVRAEGCGVVVLKRLADAIRDGDNIQGIIRGSAVNQDGLSNGLTAPNGPAQQAVISQALANAGVQPAEISYVETQATGTPLGDTIEVNALKSVLMQGREAHQPCWIGSVKTNIGHLEAAGGIAGLIKVVLSLQQGQIPAHLHLNELNPYIKIKDTPIQIPTELQEWPSQGQPRLAGVSAFGFGGTNAHVVLEEAPPQVQRHNGQERSFHVLTLSAKTEPALQDLVSRYQSHLEAHPNLELADICYTANAARSHFQHRLAVVIDSKQQLIEQLAAFQTGNDATALFRNQARKKPSKIAFLFTGESSQLINMGRQLYETQPIFRQTLEQCNEILGSYWEYSLFDLLYPDPGAEEEAASSLLKQTAYGQPALFAIEYALYQLWKSWGIQPKAVMGYDIGEYVAATVAGVFSWEDGLKLAAHRGRLEGRVAVGEKLEAQAVKTELITPILAEFSAIAEQVTYNRPKIPFVSNGTGEVADQEIATARYWVNQASGVMQCTKSMQALHQLGYQVFLEIGSQPMLLAMGHQGLPEGENLWLPSLRPGFDEWQVMLSNLAQLYVAGFKVDWAGFDRDYPHRKVALPTYPFQRQRYWIEPAPVQTPKKQPKISNLHPLLGQKLRLPGSEEQRFESQLSLTDPAYLSDYRVFNQPVLPATAYLEMALAAGSIVLKSDYLILENVKFNTPLIFAQTQEKAVQIVLKPLKNEVFQFEILSFNTEQIGGNQSFTRHASGQILKGQETSNLKIVNLSELQKEYSEKVPVEILNRELEDQSITQAVSFPGVKTLWKYPDQMLGFIELSTNLSSEVEKYKLHPVLLESCFRSVSGLKPNLEEVSSSAIELIQINRLKLYRSSASKLWSQVTISPQQTRNQETSSSDLLLFDENGVVVAEIEGLITKGVSEGEFFKSLETLQVEQEATLPTASENAHILQQIEAAENSDRLSLLIAYLQEKVARILGFKGSQLPNCDSGFFEMGMDSLMVMELRNTIQGDLKLDIPIPTFIEEANLLTLSTQINDQLAQLNITKTLQPENLNQVEETHLKDQDGIETETLHQLHESPDALTVYPLSFGQQAMWFLWQLAPESGFYNVAFTCRICSSLKVTTLQKTFEILMERHPQLRSRFPKQDNKPVQQITPTELPNLQQINAATWSEEELHQNVFQASQHPFDLENGPIMRLHLFTRSEEDHVLLLTVHHIAVDAWCLPLLMEELILIYPALESGTQPPLTPLKHSYIDYVHWQKELLSSSQGEKLWHYWQKKLAGDLPVLNLPTDRPRPPVQTYNGASHRFTLSAKLTEQLKQLAQRQGVTQSMVLLAAFQILLYRYTGQDDLLVGVPTSGRTQSEFMSLVGYFVDPMVMRVNFSENPSFQEFLAQVRSCVSEALAHQDFPFALVVERLQTKRDPSRSPIFQALFNFILQNLRQFPNSQQLLLEGEVEREGFKLKRYEISQMEGQFDLDLMMSEGNSELIGSFRYNTDLFDQETIVQMVGHFQNLLEAIVSNPQQKLSQLPLLSEAEQQQILQLCQQPIIPENSSLIAAEWAAHSPFYVLDRYGELLPFGVEGEIYQGEELGERIEEIGVNNHPKSKIQNPKSKIELGTLRKTNTWGRLRRDGTLEVLGLTHRQVWIGGHRINFQTIEQALLAISGIEDCYVLAREGKLVAYWVGSTSLSTESLKAQLQANLPDYMLPVAFVPVSNLPLTATGQIDEEVLTSLEVIETPLLDKWQQQLNTHPDIDKAVVIARPRQIPSLSPLHLARLLPARNNTVSLVADTASVVGLTPTEKPQLTTPALSDGGVLNIPEDAPKTLTEALIQTATRCKNQGITYISAKAENEFQTYASLLDEAKRILNGLRNQGLQPGQRVILQIPSLRDYFPTLWACILGGIQPVTVAVAPTYTEKNAVVNKLYNIWQLLDHPCILTSDSLIQSLENLRPLLDLPELKICSVGALRNSPPASELYPCRPDDVAFLQLTSGSTGVPKCIQETHQGIITHIHAAQQFNGYTPEDISLNWLPVDHVVPILTCHFKDTYLGCQQIEVETAVILANPLKWLDFMAEYRVSHSWSPNFGFKLISEVVAKKSGKTWDLSGVKFLMNAGEQVTPRVVREFLESVAPFGMSSEVMQPAFGMAEVCTCMTYQNQFNAQTDIYRIKKSSVGSQLELTTDSTVDAIEFTDLGLPVPGVQIRITDEQNFLLPEGVIGRLQIKGKVVTPGYLNNPKANAEAFVGEGWFNTGDLGFILNGHLVLTGREKEVIIINGANYYCYEIEDVVNSIAGVAPTFTGACAFSNQQTGTEGLAIVYSPEKTESEPNIDVIQTIRREVSSQLGISPYYVIPVDRSEFPKTTSGKIQRSLLRKKLESGEFNSLIQEIDILLGKNTIPDWFYQKVWCQKQARVYPLSTVKQPVIVFLDELGLGQSLCETLESSQNYPCIKVEAANDFAEISPEHYQINPASEEDYRRLITSLKANNSAIGHIFHLWNYEANSEEISSLETLEASQQKGLYSLQFLAKAIEQLYKTKERIRLLFVANNSQSILPNDAIAYQKATVLGFLKTIPQEMPEFDCRHIDLPNAAVELNTTYLLTEFAALTSEPEVAYRDGQRLVSLLQKTDFAQQEPEELPFKKGGVYLITGGLGGIGVKIAKYLLEHYQARLLLMGRTPLPDETGDKIGDDNDGLKAKIEAYQQLRQLPGSVLYQAVDICDELGMKQTLDLVSSQWGTQIDGVIHLAGVLQEQLITSATQECLAVRLRQKVMGTWVLHHLLHHQNLDFFIHFSSVNSFFGGTGVSGYSAANSFQEAFSTYQRQQTSRESYCLSWSMWDETGMSRGYPMKDLSQAKGYCAISPGQGMDSLLIALAHRCSHLFIGLDGSKSPIQRYTLDCQSLQQLTALFTANRPELSIEQLPLCDRFGTPTQCHFVQLDEMPLTDAGEVDIKQLTQTYTGLKVTEQTEPRNPVERQLAEIFQQVLGLEKIGIHDNFFQLGGHSVLAAQIVSEIQETFGCDLPLWVLFQSSTIAELAQLIAAPEGSSVESANGNKDIEDALAAYPCLVPIKPGGSKSPFFWIHPLASIVFPYYPVAYQLGSDHPIYGIQSPGLTGDKPPLTRVEDMAAYYIEAIRAVQPQGPYLLAGWSLGGYIAYEMAVRLKQLNQEVDLLVLVDIPPDLKTGYTAKDIGRITRIVLSFQGNLPWIYDYLALIRVREPISVQPSKSNDHTKGLIQQMLSWVGHRSDKIQVGSQNTQSLTRREQLCVTFRLFQMVMANGQALSRYKTPSYDGKIILLKTSDIELDHDETWGWRDFVKGGIDVHTVPGDHLNLLRHPHASAIAEVLKRYL